VAEATPAATVPAEAETPTEATTVTAPSVGGPLGDNYNLKRNHASGECRSMPGPGPDPPPGRTPGEAHPTRRAPDGGVTGGGGPEAACHPSSCRRRGHQPLWPAAASRRRPSAARPSGASAARSSAAGPPTAFPLAARPCQP
jgi:hypothetical protein